MFNRMIKLHFTCGEKKIPQETADLVTSRIHPWSHLLKKSLTENFIFCAVSHLIIYSISTFRNEVKVTLNNSVFHKKKRWMNRTQKFNI